MDAEILARFVDADGNVLVAGSNIIGKKKKKNLYIIFVLFK